jgi:glyoxylase-like metal-dependent hydrolase (beta-lactamase superfamily II)
MTTHRGTEAPRNLILLLVIVALGAVRGSAQVPSSAPAWTADIGAIRAAAKTIPGRLPLRVNLFTFAESRRTKNFSVKGAPATPSVQARTAFEVVYADGTVMVDAGMDQQVHRFFGRGVEEPYFPDVARQVDEAVAAARLVLVTHEHGDHVAGVIRAVRAADVARKTILTRAQAQTLLTSPQMPEIRLTSEQASRFLVLDYDTHLPVAPGIVLVKAAGHTPGSQMVYVALESGREYLFIGDAAWHMDGVRQVAGKDAPWVAEDQRAVGAQLAWLNALSRSDPRLLVVASHDEEQHAELVRRGELTRPEPGRRGTTQPSDSGRPRS